MNHPSTRFSSKLISTPSTLFFTQFKLGTRYLYRAFGKQWVHVDFNISDIENIKWDVDNSFWKILPKNHSKHSHQVKHELKCFINNSIEKDVVFLFRNPYERLKTGLVNDMFDNITANNKKIPNIDLDFDNIDDLEISQLDKKLIYYHFEKILKLAITPNSKFPIQDYSNHNNKYLYLYLQVYKKYPNIKLVELNNLSQYLKSTKVNSEHETTSNGFMKEMVSHIIDNNADISEYIDSILKDEMELYNIIKNNSI